MSQNSDLVAARPHEGDDEREQHDAEAEVDLVLAREGQRRPL